MGKRTKGPGNGEWVSLRAPGEWRAAYPAGATGKG